MKLRILLAGVVVCFSACNVDNATKSRGPIILGDSSMIVTETDPEALRDLVPDLQITEGPAVDTIAASAPADTAAAAPAPPDKPEPAVPVARGKGLDVQFREISIFIPDITTRSYSKADLKKARSATYELTGGKLSGARIQVSGATVSRVSQRYETITVLQYRNDQLPLESLGKYTSAWQALSGSGGTYTIAGLEPSRLGYKQASQSAIRNAVQQAARRQRMSRKETQDLLNATKNLRAANQAPAKVVLRSVMWRVEGKEASGKSFTKELRLDVPMS